MHKENNPFICLDCGASLNSTSSDFWECSGCSKRYPIVQGIPLFVRDPNSHKAEIETAQRTNPGWYLEKQPAEECSPWRHHLKKRRLYLEKVFQSHLNSGGLEQTGNLLDLGCGDGNNLKFLNRFAQHLYGSDYNITRLVRAAVLFPEAELFLANILDYPLKPKFFDIVFFNHVIEHIKNDDLALSTIFRILKPGGLLILGTPNEGAWWWQLAYRLQPDTLTTTDHVHFYTAKTLAERVENAGYKINDIHYMGWGPPNWKLDAKIRKYKWIDDWFERIGKVLIPHQASSLYLLAKKPEEN
jgi:SAM-dependent methyltransferase